MTSEPDLMAMGQQATEDARDSAVEAARSIKSQLVNRPAFGRQLTRQERLERHRAFVTDPVQIDARYDQLTAQFNLPEDKPIPRRLVDYLLLAQRELTKEAEDAR